MNVSQIAERIDSIVPLKLAQDWDNVGLLIGNKKQVVKNILLAIDITKEVLAEAKRLKTDLIVSYHPVIWDGLKNITLHSSSKVVYDLIKSGISVFSIHTALDAVSGGVNDGLAETVGISDPKPIGDWVEGNWQNHYKLVVFVPIKSINKVSNAIFQAGAGNIGNYSNCGFTTTGQGTFKPLKGSNPVIGKKGTLEKVDEIRFEAIVPSQCLEDVIAAMKKAHPYEMPAYDVIKLHDIGDKIGLGRIGDLAKPMKLAEIIKRIKKYTGAKAFGIVSDEKKIVKKAAVCAGSCGKIINLVIADKCDLYLTGELKHHQALAAKEAGLTCICLSHTVSERFILKKFANQLKKQLNGVTIKISKKDADPFTWKNL